MSKPSHHVFVLCLLTLLLSACDLDNLIAIAPQVREQQDFERKVAELAQRDQPIFERQEPIKS